MNILIACEESQRVCIAFRNKGHNAYSCDIQKCSGNHPEWHILQDVLKVINGNCTCNLENGYSFYLTGKWDMIIAFPPCTDLAVSGARHFEKKRANGTQKMVYYSFVNFLQRTVTESPLKTR